MNRVFTNPCSDKDTLKKGIGFVESTIKELGVDNKLSMRTVLMTEELIPQFIENSTPEGKIRISVRKFMGEISVTITSEGREFDPFESETDGLFLSNDISDKTKQRAIRSILLKSLENNLKFTHHNGVNTARITVGKSETKRLYLTALAAVLGLLIGFMIKTVLPEVISTNLEYYFLVPVKTMFFNALKIVIGPVVFFSIVTCFAQFKDLSELGRIAGKVMGFYLSTTAIAVAISITLSKVFSPGEFGAALDTVNSFAPDIEINPDIDTSIRSTIVDIVPDNFLSPILEGNMLQIIFLAVLCGLAIGRIGKYAPVMQKFFDGCNSVALEVTSMITRFIPLAVLCTTALVISKVELDSLLHLLSYVGVFTLGILCMLIVYGLAILIVGRLNPLTFFKKNLEGMVTSFSLCSSSAMMPVNMRICTEKMGISPKVSSFSIPLGATVNMDGSCINLTMSALFLAKMYGINVPTSTLISMAVTIILLSVGSPGVPGAGLVCIAVVLRCIGCPLEAVGLIMTVYPFVDLLITMSNTTGDMAATLVVAKSEHLLDERVFKS